MVKNLDLEKNILKLLKNGPIAIIIKVNEASRIYGLKTTSTLLMNILLKRNKK